MKLGAQLLGAAAVHSLFSELSARWGGSPQWQVTAGAGHAEPVEFGTWKMAAQPYMRPAADAAVGRGATYARQSNSIETMAQAVAYDIRDDARQYAPVDTGELRGSISAGKQ